MGLPGVRVDLVDPSTGAILDSRETDSDGRYEFELDPAQSYQFVVEGPAGYTFSPQDASNRLSEARPNRPTASEQPDR